MVDTYTPWGKNASLEDSTELTEAEIEAGAQPGPFTAKRYTTVTNRADVAINEIIKRGPKCNPDDATESEFLMNIHSPENSFFVPQSPLNRIDYSSGGLGFRHVFQAIIGGQRKILATTNNLSICIFDADTMSHEQTVSISSASLPSGSPSPVWQSRRVVCDSDSAYVSFRDSNASSATYDNNQLQAYDLVTWSVKIGWPSTGVNIGQYGSSVGHPCLSNANSNYLAASNPYVAITGSSSAAINLISKANGTISSSGAGDCSAGYRAYKLCSDGTNIYFLADNGTYVNMASATIADLTTGIWSIPYRVANAGDAYDIACGCGFILSVASDSSDRPIVARRIDSDYPSFIFVLPTDDAFLDVPGLFSVCFDGKYFWSHGLCQPSSIHQALYKIDLSSVNMISGPDVITGNNVDHPPVLLEKINFENQYGVTHQTNIGTLASLNIISDGRDIWFSGDPSTGNDQSGIIYRLPKTNLR